MQKSVLTIAISLGKTCKNEIQTDYKWLTTNQQLKLLIRDLRTVGGSLYHHRPDLDHKSTNAIYLKFINVINVRGSLDNHIGQNVITWGIFTDGKDMAYQNQSSAYVPAVHQLFYLVGARCAMRI